MTHSNEVLQKYTAIYRCSDDIINLKIKIKLKEVENGDEWEERIFGWQEKVFSRSEREFYRDEKNCITDLEKKYHLDAMKSAGVGKYDIFSYINDDNFTLKEDTNHENEEEDPEEYDYKRSVMTAARNRANHSYEFDAMFIMADLGEYIDTSWIKREEILCSIKYDKKFKLISICPDFTQYGPYSITIDGSTSRTFQFFIDNVSESMSEDDQHKELELIKKLNSHKQFGATFILSPKNKLQVYLFFEILWAKQFEYDTIYVQYFIDLPSGWSCDDQSQLQGVTQTCRTKGEEMLAHFGHAFDAVLSYNIEGLGEKGVPKSPYIYFEVISKDTWSRFRTEGLTYKHLPVAKPGIHRFELQCFRLLPDNISGHLRRFFIGDCSNYSDITWTGLPKDYEGSFLNKYGTNTVGTGQIGLRVNVMQQSQAFLEQYNDKSDGSQDVFEKLNSSSLVKSVEQVLQAFKRARKNMIAVRKNM